MFQTGAQRHAHPHAVPSHQREEAWIECTDTPVRVGQVVFNVVHYMANMPSPKPDSLHCTERRGVLDDTMLGRR